MAVSDQDGQAFLLGLLSQGPLSLSALRATFCDYVEGSSSERERAFAEALRRLVTLRQIESCTEIGGLEIYALTDLGRQHIGQLVVR